MMNSGIGIIEQKQNCGFNLSTVKLRKRIAFLTFLQSNKKQIKEVFQIFVLFCPSDSILELLEFTRNRFSMSKSSEIQDNYQSYVIE